MGVVKYWGKARLPTVNVSAMVFENTIRDLLLVQQYRVEVFESQGKGQPWQLAKKVAPTPGHPRRSSPRLGQLTRAAASRSRHRQATCRPSKTSSLPAE
jgi:hypothetical protein